MCFLEIVLEWPTGHHRRITIAMARKMFKSNVVICRITKNNFTPDDTVPVLEMHGITATWVFPAPYALEPYWRSILPRKLSMSNGKTTRVFIAHCQFLTKHFSHMCQSSNLFFLVF